MFSGVQKWNIGLNGLIKDNLESLYFDRTNKSACWSTFSYVLDRLTNKKHFSSTATFAKINFHKNMTLAVLNHRLTRCIPPQLLNNFRFMLFKFLEDASSFLPSSLRTEGNYSFPKLITKFISRRK